MCCQAVTLYYCDLETWLTVLYYVTEIATVVTVHSNSAVISTVYSESDTL